MSPNFTRTVEDFVCERCRENVVGDGYTNHCPKCLWSRHVDCVPGDRTSICRGMMRPVNLKKTAKKKKSIEGEGWTILHQCIECGFERWQRCHVRDSFEELLKLSHTGAIKQ